MLVTGLLLAASPMAAQGQHGHGVGEPGGVAPGWVDVALLVVLLTGTAVVAGMGLLRLFTERFTERTILIAVVAAVLTAASLLLLVFLGSVSVLIALPQTVATLVIPMFLRRRPGLAGIVASLLVIALLVAATGSRTGVEWGVTAAHTLAGVAVIAVAVLVASAEAADRRALVNRVGWLAVAGVVVLACTGIVQGWLVNLRPDAISAGSTLGRLVMLEVVLIIAAVAGVVALRRRGAPAYQAGAVLLTAAVATGAALGAAPPLAPPAPAGQPVLRTVALGAGQVEVVVVPHRPGPNLVWVSGDGYTVGTGATEMIPAASSPGSPGGWAVVDLPAGASALWIARGGDRTPLRLAADPAVPALPGITGPNGPECLAAVVGGVIADGPVPSSCPADQLPPAEATALRGLVGSLAARSVSGIRLVTGDSARSVAAAEVITGEAARVGISVDGPAHPDDARVVVGGWSKAEETLLIQQRDPVSSGVYFAPWLANGTLLGYTTGALVALNFDTTGDTPLAYVDALNLRGSRALASPAGYHAWLAATGRAQPTGPTQLYAAIAGFDMMGVDPTMRRGHSTSASGWIPGGRMTPVSEPLIP